MRDILIGILKEHTVKHLPWDEDHHILSQPDKTYAK
jgi:hypothetical protein